MSAREPRRPGELTFTVILVLCSLWLFWEAYLISGFSGLATPGVFPMLATGVLIVSTATILVSALRSPSPGGGALRFLREVTPLRHAIVLGLVAGYVALMPLLGFVVSSGLFLFISLQVLWRRNPLVTAILTAGSLAAIYVIFRIVFQVVLPTGTVLQGLS
ncbi:MAG: tripartite tricarboxylate transporter TctB family protein [Alphaproteobacteria bacterium]